MKIVRMRKRKGFTMVELMVVIIIIAILGLAVMPSLVGSSEKAKYSRAWNDLNAISNAFTAFYGRVGNLPSITSGALGSDSVSGSVTDLSGASLNAKDLLQSFLGTPLENLKDPWGNPYQIMSSWNPSTGKGHIIIYVTGGTTAASFGKDSSGKDISVNARPDPYNNNQPMAKLVINVM